MALALGVNIMAKFLDPSKDLELIDRVQYMEFKLDVYEVHDEYYVILEFTRGGLLWIGTDKQEVIDRAKRGIQARIESDAVVAAPYKLGMTDG
jgi:hypothetical protein